jgi:hypothetical protein
MDGVIPMARIRCKYVGCTYLDQGLCAAPVIELDPDEGCMTFTQIGDPYDDDDDWDDDLDGYQEWDDDDFDDSLYDDDDDF